MPISPFAYERRAIELDALTSIDLRWAIERQVIGVLGDDPGALITVSRPGRGRPAVLIVIVALADLFGGW